MQTCLFCISFFGQYLINGFFELQWHGMSYRWVYCRSGAYPCYSSWTSYWQGGWCYCSSKYCCWSCLEACKARKEGNLFLCVEAVLYLSLSLSHPLFSLSFKSVSVMIVASCLFYLRYPIYSIFSNFWVFILSGMVFPLESYPIHYCILEKVQLFTWFVCLTSFSYHGIR